MSASPPAPCSPSTPGRTALCTVLNDDFVPGFAVLVHSLKQRHPGLNLPFIIIHNRKLAPLSKESRELVSRLYSNVRYHEADDSRYGTVWANRDEHLHTPERLKPAFFILEAFALDEFDRVVTLDSDMICTGSLTALFEHAAPFAATRSLNYKTGKPLDYFNTGVMVIGRLHLTGETYQALLNHRISPDYNARKGKADQAILNDYFPIEQVCALDEAFNVTKRKYPDTAFNQINELLTENLRILHFVGEKPWQLHLTPEESNYAKLENLWASILQEALTPGEILHHLRLQQLKLSILQERQSRLADLRRYAGNADTVISRLLDDLDGILPERKTSLWGRLTGVFRHIRAGTLRRNISKARKKWSRQQTRMARQLSAMTENP
ncbi:MAG: polysaccharide pyruvyl transferase [Rariglobus sp.]|jgi:lipopolysaccharide biosynthesis glycosyltransferase|nr:polysaccharide pyruvyl transferase [Rariglobus sp.]